MKLTVIAKEDGTLVAAAYGHTPQPDTTEAPVALENFRAGLLAGPGQQLHVLDVPDDFLQGGAAADFHHRVEAELRKKRK